MTSAAIWIPVALVMAALMELWAGLLHGRFWHRVLWPVHRSHHRKRRGRFEANDALSALHAPIAIALILYGCMAAESPLREVAFGVGIGMTLFGVAYLVVHDGLAHGRLPVQFLGRIPFFARVRDAHRVHHGGGRAVPYGFFLGPQELERAQRLSGAHAAAPGRSEDPNARPPLDPSA
jgi:beta-carotene 3-hydroxylase